jgi:hypothetical protein
MTRVDSLLVRLVVVAAIAPPTGLRGPGKERSEREGEAAAMPRIQLGYEKEDPGQPRTAHLPPVGVCSLTE